MREKIFGFLRIGLGWIFLWAFFDKLFGLGFATLPESSWLAGGSPTSGFLQFATKGPFVEFYHSLAGSNIVDCLFMFGLLLIGLSLVLGIMTRLASLFGVIMMVLMYTAVMPPEHNPLVDDHIIYALVLISFFFMPVGEWIGFGKSWSRTKIVQKFPFLR